MCTPLPGEAGPSAERQSEAETACSASTPEPRRGPGAINLIASAPQLATLHRFLNDSARINTARRIVPSRGNPVARINLAVRANEPGEIVFPALARQTVDPWHPVLCRANLTEH
ncbi:MAG: hypothetical protein D6753_18295 [Planctomycetota bacterium]|nr:MAG: hypothetical protein D6753_18295 [Planctomycetota bacterium]